MRDRSNETTWEAQVARARADFVKRGESIADWSRRHGFQPNAVYQVLGGYTQAMRGNGHRIAVALGIKPSATDDEAKEKNMT